MQLPGPGFMWCQMREKKWEGERGNHIRAVRPQPRCSGNFDLLPLSVLISSITWLSGLLMRHRPKERCCVRGVSLHAMCACVCACVCGEMQRTYCKRSRELSKQLKVLETWDMRKASHVLSLPVSRMLNLDEVANKLWPGFAVSVKILIYCNYELT